MPTHLLARLIVVAVVLGRVRAQVLWTPIYLDSNSEYYIMRIVVLFQLLMNVAASRLAPANRHCASFVAKVCREIARIKVKLKKIATRFLLFALS